MATIGPETHDSRDPPSAIGDGPDSGVLALPIQ